MGYGTTSVHVEMSACVNRLSGLWTTSVRVEMSAGKRDGLQGFDELWSLAPLLVLICRATKALAHWLA